VGSDRSRPYLNGIDLLIRDLTYPSSAPIIGRLALSAIFHLFETVVQIICPFVCYITHILYFGFLILDIKNQRVVTHMAIEARVSHLRLRDRCMFVHN